MALIVAKPPTNTARLRFVTGNDVFSRLIRLNDEEAPVSHVEAVMSDGTIIAALIGEGVVRKPGDYCQTNTYQRFIDLPMTADMYGHWVAGLQYRLGEKYDNMAILGYVFHNVSLHDPRKLICSALQVDVLGDGHSKWCDRRLSQKYHAIDPATLQLMLEMDARTICHEGEFAK